jgi:hypothetical protein
MIDSRKSITYFRVLYGYFYARNVHLEWFTFAPVAWQTRYTYECDYNHPRPRFC